MVHVIRSILAVMLIGLIAWPAAAGSAPKPVTPSDTLVQKVHGCHFDTGPGMEPDRVNGHHYHDRNCRVVRLGPPPRARYRDNPPPRRRYRESAPPRGPICREQCRYIGPIKRCRTVCN